MEDFNVLITEMNNPDTRNLDVCSTLEMVKLINAEDKKVADAVEKVLPAVANAIDEAAKRMAKGGRMLYFGAGTSGRLGVIDASECPPTFGTSPELVQGIIAGGNESITNAAKGDEDNGEAAACTMEKLGVSQKDVVVGIAASGRTPYVLGALKAAGKAGALTIGICNNPHVPMIDLVDIAIVPVTGPEALQGSTRLKAGTAQKMILNMLSTGTMIKLGKIYQNMMVDMVPSNEKLFERAKRLVSDATGCDRDTATMMLEQTGFHVKTAITAILCNVKPGQAKRLLDDNGGSVSRVLENERNKRT